MADSRSILLRRIIDDVTANGLADRSLRDLAAAAGTSHRMVLYHFGSRDGLVAAIVADVEAAQRETMTELATTADSPAELVRALWARVSAPELRPFVRLFFESLAATAPTDSSRVPGPGADQLTAPWLDDSGPIAAQLGFDADPVEIRLGVAVVRGLLIDVLATGDVADATRSLERYLAMWEGSRAAADEL